MKDLEEQEYNQWKLQSHPDPSQRMPEHIFKKLNEDLLHEKEEIQQALCKAYESMPEPVNYEEKILLFSNALTALRDPEASAQEKNKLLKACIERIEYSRERPKRLTGIKGKDNGLKVGGNWSNPPIELDVKLKV